MSYDQRLAEAIRTIAELFRGNAALNIRCARLIDENAKLRKENERLNHLLTTAKAR